MVCIARDPIRRKIKKLEEQCSRDEIKIFDSLDKGNVNQGLAAYMIACIQVDLNTEKAKIYRKNGDETRFDFELCQARTIIMALSSRYSDKLNDRISSESYMDLINTLIRKYNQVAPMEVQFNELN